MNPVDVLKEHVSEFRDSFNSHIVIGSSSVGVTQYIFWMVIVWVITLCVVLIVSKKLKLVPNNKFINTVEYGYQFVRNDIGQNVIGHGYRRYVPYLATLFFFILLSNFMGLIPGCSSPTGSISVTWALSTISFVYFNFCGIREKGGLGYLKAIAPSGLPVVIVPFIWILEFISLVVRWLSLAVRLYGNMFAGHLMLGMFAIASSVFLTTAIQSINVLSGVVTIGWFAILVVIYALEALVAFLQAFVFTILSSVYIQLAVASH